jgi:hypothetical protein
MVNKSTTCGLLITHSAQPSALVAEVVAVCDWPLVAQPSLRALIEQIELRQPLCVAFWIDATSELAPTAKLVDQLRIRGPRPYRIAIAHNLDTETEHILRAAGVHTYLVTTGDIVALVEGALLPFIEPHRTPSRVHQTHVRDSPVGIRGPTDHRASPAKLHPP